MVKYLKAKEAGGGDELVVTRTPASDKAIVFEYDLLKLIKTIYETCQNMVKIATSENGTILVDEYSMDDQTPTDDMKNQLFNTAASEIMEKLYRFVSDDIVINETGGYEVEYSASVKTARFPIDNVDKYETSILESIDKYISDMIVYGVLDAWFTAVNSDVLKNMALSKYNIANSRMSMLMKPLFRKYRFSKVSNYQ